ncbi:membrane protein [Croceibacterium mercuriale]|uniref:Membrane protein n=1 Tax=Croceibacterium mercuriale TaxID=1572751 RepID=A0A0B2BXN3_9SPHN|nr:HPP family protein [Croceibacterium mercuriale]KHL24446.1 membrane protein [Croceibacterium mercuriale]
MSLFNPLLAGAHTGERLLACIGAAIGIGLTMVVCAGLPIGAAANIPIIVAPLGASAVLVFAVPSSPLAQPWPVVGGNIISTLIGVTAFHLVPQAALAAGLAVGAAILVMSLLRCLHPPGGAAALTAVIGGSGVHDAGYAFAFAPVGINSIALVALALMIHRATARSYPHVPPPSAPTGPVPGLQATDIDAALDEMHESFDISRADLDALLTRAQAHAAHRGTPGPSAPIPPAGLRRGDRPT